MDKQQRPGPEWEEPCKTWQYLHRISVLCDIMRLSAGNREKDGAIIEHLHRVSVACDVIMKQIRGNISVRDRSINPRP